MLDRFIRAETYFFMDPFLCAFHDPLLNLSVRCGDLISTLFFVLSNMYNLRSEQVFAAFFRGKVHKEINTYNVPATWHEATLGVYSPHDYCLDHTTVCHLISLEKTLDLQNYQDRSAHTYMLYHNPILS